ncbi:MAG: hypothetical protein H0X19_01250 [Rubrobacter sp.]|nr:hypothetical protein [Rubrobacter sp.]
MAKVKLTLEVEPELRRRIKLSATAKDESLREWVHRAILRELETEGSEARNEGIIDEERGYYPSQGGKPRGSKHPPRPKSGRTVAEAVIEDRR